MPKNPLHRKNKKNTLSGMTMVELLVSVSIAAIVSVVITNFFSDTISFNRIVSGKLNVTGEARRAIKRMTSEIRVVSPSSLGEYALHETATSSFTFYTNIDDDEHKERVRYFLDGDTLRRGVIEPTGNPLTYASGNETFTDMVHNIENGTSSIFFYYGDVYSTTEPSLVAPFDVSSVRLVKIEFLVNGGSANNPDLNVFTTQVMLRNLKDNL